MVGISASSGLIFVPKFPFLQHLSSPLNTGKEIRLCSTADDIGYLDDAFVIRISAKSALAADIGNINNDLKNRLSQLAHGTDVITQFLGEALSNHLQKYSDKLTGGAARGRTVS